MAEHERPEEIERVGPRWSVLLAGLRRPRRFLGELIARIWEDDTSTQAAAMSYFFFLAMFPLLLFVLALVSLLPVQGLEDWLLASAAQVVPGEAYAVLESTVRDVLAEPRGGLLSIGAVLALWAASSGFLSVINGLNLAYRVRETRSWWRLRLHALGLTVALSGFMVLAFVLAVFGGQLATWLGDVLLAATVPFSWLNRMVVPILLVARWVIVLTVIMVVVGTIYVACPDVEQRWRWVSVGVLIFTLGFGLTSAGFSYYVDQFASYDKTYGSLGAVIILLVWMYILAFFLLLGGQVNALLEHMSPAGKDAGEHDQPPGEVQVQRIESEERAAASARGERYG